MCVCGVDTLCDHIYVQQSIRQVYYAFSLLESFPENMYVTPKFGGLPNRPRLTVLLADVIPSYLGLSWPLQKQPSKLDHPTLADPFVRDMKGKKNTNADS
jgi:hypothetical protein